MVVFVARERKMLLCRGPMMAACANALMCLAVQLYCASAQQICQDGEVQLSGGRNEREGRVEMCFDNKWGTICHKGLDSNDASVVCRQLGLATSAAIVIDYPSFGEGTGPIHLYYLQCEGDEESLEQCPRQKQGNHNCGHAEDAGVYCQPADFTCTDGQIRLADGDGENQGRVEICFDNQYGTICDYQWDNSDAAVVCGQLGFSRESAIGIPGTQYGPGIGNIYLHYVGCSGTEPNITQCTHQPGVDCDHFDDAGVLCTHTSMLSSDSGRTNIVPILVVTVFTTLVMCVVLFVFLSYRDWTWRLSKSTNLQRVCEVPDITLLTETTSTD